VCVWVCDGMIDFLRRTYAGKGCVFCFVASDLPGFGGPWVDVHLECM